MVYHDEPFYVAADIAGRPIKLSGERRIVYDAILAEADW